MIIHCLILPIPPPLTLSTPFSFVQLLICDRKSNIFLMILFSCHSWFCCSLSINHIIFGVHNYRNKHLHWTIIVCLSQSMSRPFCFEPDGPTLWALNVRLYLSQINVPKWCLNFSCRIFGKYSQVPQIIAWIKHCPHRQHCVWHVPKNRCSFGYQPHSSSWYQSSNG